MTVIHLTCWRTPPLRSNDRRSWPAQARAVAQAKEQAAWVLRAARIDPMQAADAVLTYRPKTRRVQDSGSISPTLKVVLDAAVQVGVLPADDYLHVPRETCQVIPPDGEPGLWLELVPVEQAASA